MLFIVNESKENKTENAKSMYSFRSFFLFISCVNEKAKEKKKRNLNE